LGIPHEDSADLLKGAKLNTDRVYSLGAHGWRGRWLVNGSSRNIVELAIDPPARALVMGLPVSVRTLYVSVTDPDALVAECAPGSGLTTH
jgi:hypothetical protein